MKKFLIVVAALTLTACGDRFITDEVICMNTPTREVGYIEGTKVTDNLTSKSYLKFRDTRGTPQRLDITNEGEWICAERITVS